MLHLFILCLSQMHCCCSLGYLFPVSSWQSPTHPSSLAFNTAFHKIESSRQPLVVLFQSFYCMRTWISNKYWYITIICFVCFLGSQSRDSVSSLLLLAWCLAYGYSINTYWMNVNKMTLKQGSHTRSVRAKHWLHITTLSYQLSSSVSCAPMIVGPSPSILVNYFPVCLPH